MAIRKLATGGYVERYAVCPDCFAPVRYYELTCEDGRTQMQCRCTACRWFQSVPMEKNRGKRESTAARHWREQVLKRDGYRCVRCGSADGLEAHHIMPWSKFPDLRYNILNGETLCRACHDKEHPWRVDKDWKAAKA